MANGDGQGSPGGRANSCPGDVRCEVPGVQEKTGVDREGPGGGARAEVWGLRVCVPSMQSVSGVTENRDLISRGEKKKKFFVEWPF